MSPRQQLRLRGNILLHLGSGAENTHVLAQRSGVSYPTMSMYVRGTIQRLDLNVLGGILFDGLEMTPEQVLNMRLSDLFEIWQSSAPDNK